MSDVKEVSYKCSADATHPTWSGIEGEIPTACAQCGAEGELVEPEAPTGETGEVEETTELRGGGTFSADGEIVSSETVEVAKYRITGLVDYSDEQGYIRGQYPIGSVQELPVEVGDVAANDGRAERVEDTDEEVE